MICLSFISSYRLFTYHLYLLSSLYIFSIVSVVSSGIYLHNIPICPLLSPVYHHIYLSSSLSFLSIIYLPICLSYYLYLFISNCISAIYDLYVIYSMYLSSVIYLFYHLPVSISNSLCIYFYLPIVYLYLSLTV